MRIVSENTCCRIGERHSWPESWNFARGIIQEREGWHMTQNEMVKSDRMDREETCEEEDCQCGEYIG